MNLRRQLGLALLLLVVAVMAAVTGYRLLGGPEVSRARLATPTCGSKLPNATPGASPRTSERKRAYFT